MFLLQTTSSSGYSFVLLLGTLGMLVLTVGLIIFIILHQKRVKRFNEKIQDMEKAQQRLLLNASIKLQEEERQRLAADLRVHSRRGPLTLRATAHAFRKRQGLAGIGQPGATLEVFIWSMDLTTLTPIQNLPIEEIAFYFFGIAFTLVLYIWADLHWFGLYSSPARARLPPRGARVRLDPHAVLLGAGLVALAYAYKKLLSPVPDGFPGYFAFLVAFALVPACSVYRAVRDRINWRAFSFAMLVMFTVSTWWEATVAFPYQWWTYRDEMMIGVFIKAWNGLPVEEPLLWLLVSFTTVLTFEANLLDLLGKRSAAELLFVASAHPRPGPML